MGFELSFGGVPFSPDPPAIHDDLRVQNYLLDYIHSTTAVPDLTTWPSPRLQGLALPSTAWRPRPAIGQFFYPTGASRWAEFFGLVDTDRKNQMLQKALPINGSPVAQNFVVQCDPSPAADELAADGFSTPMFLLEARPLLVVSPKFQGLWLITLVDERFYWQRMKDAGKYHPLRTSSPTWSALFTSLASSLGITLSHGAISSNYGSPSEDSPLWSNYEMAAQLLDAAAANCGLVLVRNISGTYELQTPATAVTDANNQRDLITRTSGGAMLEKDPGEKIIRTAQAILPAKVRVTFPKFVVNQSFVDTRDTRDHDMPGYGDAYPIDITLSQAGYANYVGYSGAKMIRDTARAYLAKSSDTTPLNYTELNNLATQLAKDYYAACFSQLDEVYPGIRAWEPEGVSDIIWFYSQDACWTRVIRRPWDDDVSEMQHECLGTSPGTQTTTNGDPSQTTTKIYNYYGSSSFPTYVAFYPNVNLQFNAKLNVNACLVMSGASADVTAPTNAPTVSVGGAIGSWNVGSHTYYCKITYVDQNGTESPPSPESAQFTIVGTSPPGAGQFPTVALNNTPPANISYWRVYFTQSDGASGTETGPSPANQGGTTIFDVPVGTVSLSFKVQDYGLSPAAPPSSSSTPNSCFHPPLVTAEPTYSDKQGDVVIDVSETSSGNAYPVWWVQMTGPSGTLWKGIIGTATKGDLIAGGSDEGESTILPISGTDNKTLLCKDSSQTTGMKWLDLTGLPGYSGGSVQLLGHDASGNLTWYTVATC